MLISRYNIIDIDYKKNNWEEVMLSKDWQELKQLYASICIIMQDNVILILIRLQY